MPLCRHCCKRRVTRPRRLCIVCWNTPGVAALYPIGTRERYDHLEHEDDPRPERQPGEPPYRCLLCMRWRCDLPLKRCTECHEEIMAATADFPLRTQGMRT